MARIFLAILLSFFTLAGCTSLTKEGREKSRLSYEKWLGEIYAAYIDQFSITDTDYATLRGYPYPGYDTLKTGGYAPIKVNDKAVTTLFGFKDKHPYPANWMETPHYGYYFPDQSDLPLKIKSGAYGIEIWGGAYSPKRTTFKRVEISKGKNYIIYPTKKIDTTYLSINEYITDKRFTPSEKEYYIVGKAVSDLVPYGE